MLMYAVDYDGRLPQAWFDADGNARYDPSLGPEGASDWRDGPGDHEDYAWSYALFAYTKSFQIFTCKFIPVDQNWDGRVAPMTDQHGISYGMNHRFGEADWRLDRLTWPAETVLLCDVIAGLREPWLGLPDGGNAWQAESLGDVALRARDNHAERKYGWRGWLGQEQRWTMVGFADGHVRAHKLEALLQTGDRTEGNLWDPVR
jgi:prepilin-type processing-associated H-X9-DG protein